MPSTLWDTRIGDQSGGDLPKDTAISFGGGSANLTPDGMIYKYVSATGTSPGATAADNVIGVFSLPAGTFDVALRGIEISAIGAVAANTNNKTIKIILNPSTAVLGSTVGSGGTTMASTGVYATSLAANFMMGAGMYKYGAAGSNTQLGICRAQSIGATSAVLIVPTAITAVESGAILIAVTGNAGTTASDIVLNFLTIRAVN